MSIKRDAKDLNYDQSESAFHLVPVNLTININNFNNQRGKNQNFDDNSDSTILNGKQQDNTKVNKVSSKSGIDQRYLDNQRIDKTEINLINRSIMKEQETVLPIKDYTKQHYYNNDGLLPHKQQSSGPIL